MNFAWRLLALAARLGRDRRGGIATTAAIAIPALALLVCGGIDLAAVNADRAELQAIVDAAALDAAKQIAVADSVGVEARARAFIDAQTTNLDQVTYSVTTTVSPDGPASPSTSRRAAPRSSPTCCPPAAGRWI